MTFFRFEIGARARTAGRLIGRVRSELMKAVTEEREASGLTQQALARKLEVSRAAINRQLAGESELTLRDVADIAWALDRDVSFALHPREPAAGQNFVAATTLASSPMRLVGPSTPSSTLPSRPQTQVSGPRGRVGGP